MCLYYKINEQDKYHRKRGVRWQRKDSVAQ